jgi:hypothetical protein
MPYGKRRFQDNDDTLISTYRKKGIALINKGMKKGK